MRKLIKTFLHLWISMVSLAAFGVGWAFLAHSQKPVPLVAPQAQVVTSSQSTLEPVPSIDQYLNFDSSQAPVLQNSTDVRPRLRTGGS
jgi:hypothetical protein